MVLFFLYLDYLLMGAKYLCMSCLLFPLKKKTAASLLKRGSDTAFFLRKVENFKENDPANIYLLKVNNKNTRKRCEICSKIIIKTTNLDNRIGKRHL